MSTQTIGPRPHFPTSTIHAIRLCLFQATRRPKKIEKIIETSFGKIRVKGRLGQNHLDVFEAICFSREKKREIDGRIQILVDPWEVRKKSNQMAGATLKRITDDLLEAIIEIIEPDRLACIGHLVDHIDVAIKPSSGEKIIRPGAFGDRKLWTIKLGEAFCRLVQKDVWVGYDPAPIARFNHGITQAVTRHVLTHKLIPPGGWRLDTLIEAVEGTLTSGTLRKYRERIRSEAHRMAHFGIVIDKERVKIRVVKTDLMA